VPAAPESPAEVQPVVPAVEAPKSILPSPARPGPVLPPAPERTGEAATPQVPATGISGQAGEGSGITAVALEQVDPSSVGLIDVSSGGFPSNMWARSDRPLIEKLIPLLPAGDHSPAMQSLLRRILLTAAVVPAGEGGVPNMLALRLDRLAGTGDLPDVLDLLGRLPADAKDGDIQKLKVDASLLAGDYSTACAETANIAQSDANPYWSEVQGFCHVLKGDMAAAALAVEMLQDKGVEAPAYYQLMARLTAADTAQKDSIDFSKLGQPTPLLISMIQTAKLEIPASVVTKASPMMTEALAAAVDLPIDLRLLAAERAARNGALKPEKLAEIYAAVTFTPEERAEVLELANGASGPESPRINALLYQTIGATQDINALGPLLQALWARAKRQGTLPLQARVNAKAVAGIELSAEALPFIKEIARLLLLAGEYERFGQWYDLVRLRAAPDNPDATEAMLDLWPLATIADARGSLLWQAGTLDQWRQSQSAPGPEARQERGALLFSILESLGYQIPDSQWAGLVAGPPVREAPQLTLPYWRALLMAARDKRLGETVLLSLISLSDGGPGKASPVILGNVITSLGAVDLGREAREIALEALMARDF
jgi:hypothetical protein